MIVWLASYPRSGNTLFRIALHYVYGVWTYSSSDNDPQFFDMGVDEVIGHKKLPQPISHLLRLHDYTEDEPWFIKTHCNGNEIPRSHKVIHIVRDGRAACVSKSIRMMDWSDTDDKRDLPTVLWKHVSAEGGWSNYVLSWFGRADVHVKYEDLLDDPIGAVMYAIETLDLNWDMEPDRNAELPSFEELHAEFPDFFRKGTKTSWKDGMSDKYEKVFWRNHGNAMRLYDYA